MTACPFRPPSAVGSGSTGCQFRANEQTKDKDMEWGRITATVGSRKNDITSHVWIIHNIFVVRPCLTFSPLPLWTLSFWNQLARRLVCCYCCCAPSFGSLSPFPIWHLLLFLLFHDRLPTSASLRHVSWRWNRNDHYKEVGCTRAGLKREVVSRAFCTLYVGVSMSITRFVIQCVIYSLYVHVHIVSFFCNLWNCVTLQDTDVGVQKNAQLKLILHDCGVVSGK